MNMTSQGISGFFAGVFLKNNSDNMTTIKELLGQGDVPKPKRNFLQENVRRLREMKIDKSNKINSQRNKNVQQTERKKPQTVESTSRQLPAQSAASRLQSSPPRNRRKQQTLDLPSLDDTTPKGYRTQGCQTLNGRQLENLYDEGMIRYPSARLQEVVETDSALSENVREMGLQTDAPLEVLYQPPPARTHPHPADESADGLNWEEDERKLKDFVKLNATIPEPHRVRTVDTSTDSGRKDPTRPPANYQRGVIPKYLKEHKKEMERERMVKAKEAADECPEGHILLPDEIRQKHLSTLRDNYRDLVSQLNQLPVSTDTLRTRTRKKQIEADLDRIEAAIALFSREKVFVRADS